ncbi:hypothetical protein GM240_22945 [Peribacillus butanolivorans]|nr:hypothetical protein GM240_22945 [Peribacillus butanolivorans]
MVRKETRAYQGLLQEEINETIERVFADVKEKHVCVGLLYGDLKIVDAGDAYFRCHEFKEDSQLDMARSKNGLIKWARKGPIS